MSEDRTLDPDRGAWLFEPRPSLRGLIFAAVARDTRKLKLEARDRYNCLPASPFCALTFIFEGGLHLIGETGEIAKAPLPALNFSGPQRRPMLSYAPGPVHALTVVFYPDAWREVSGFDAPKFADIFVPAEAALDERTHASLAALLPGRADPQEKWRVVEEQIEELFGPRAANGPVPFVRDWTRSLFARAALSSAGRSARQAQRRLKSWTGLSRSQLEAHARVEALFERTHGAAGPVNLAELAAEAGYADQSHMGREIKRLTGVSPAELIGRIRSEERYWLYRLLGERY